MESITRLDVIVCPYCEYEHELNSDYFDSGNEFEDEEFQCNECNKYFKVYGVVEFEFWSTSTPLPKDER